MKTTLSIICALAASAAFAQDFASGASSTITIAGDNKPQGPVLTAEEIKVPGLTMPESVAVRKGKLYVANVGGAPMQSPKKGFITISDTNGRNTKTLFKGKLDDPKGFGFFSDSIIIISDHPTVKVLDLAKESILASTDIPGAGFLNDIVVLDQNNALLSDTGKGIVYLLTYKGSSLTATPVKGLDGTVSGVNGMYYANKKLYLVTSTFGGDAKAGNVYTFSFTKGWTEGNLSKPWASKQIGAGGLDGIYVKGDDVLISDWGKGGTKTSANFYFISESTKKFVMGTGGRSSIADFCVSEDGWIYFPEMMESKVIKIKYPR